MQDRPALVIAHHPSLELFDDHAPAMASEVAEVLDPAPIGDWADPRTDDLLARTEVILFANKDVFWQRDVRRTPRDPTLREFRRSSRVPVGNYDKTIGIVGG
jgi:hypothetical protein